MFLLETFLVNIYNVLILRLSTFRKLDSGIAAITTLVLNLFFTLLFIADFAANELFTVEVCISIPKINFLNFIWVNPCIKLGDISSLSTFQPPVNFTAQSPFDLWDTKGWTPFHKCGNYYQCQPSLFIDPALMPKTCISWKTKNEALLERVNLDFYTNIVHITQWRSTAVSFAGGSVMDIFLCTSPEYFYTFRAEYIYKNNSVSSLKKLLPPITKELVQSIIVQLPPTDAKPFYISDNLIFVYNNGLPQPGGDSITASLYYNKGLGQLGGAITAESIYFCYTPSLPFIFNFSSMYIPTTFT